MVFYAILSTYGVAFARGLVTTLYLAVVSCAIGTVLAVVIALGRLFGPRPLRIVLRCVVEVLLALPVLVIIIWVHYGWPVGSVPLSRSGSAILALSISLGAFLSEDLRAGFLAFPKGQLEVGLAMGLSLPRALRRLVLPQIARTMLPAIFAQYITCLKMTCLASVIAVEEVTYVSQLVIAETFQPLASLSLLALCYLLAVLPLSLLARRLSSEGAVRQE